MDWMDIMDEMDEVDKHRRTRTCTDRDIRIMRSRGIIGGMIWKEWEDDRCRRAGKPRIKIRG